MELSHYPNISWLSLDGFWWIFFCGTTPTNPPNLWGPMMPFGWARWGFSNFWSSDSIFPRVCPDYRLLVVFVVDICWKVLKSLHFLLSKLRWVDELCMIQTWRCKWQVLNSRANPAHPYHRFGTGNFKTLLEDTAAKGAALCNLESWLQGVRIAWCRPGINLRAELLAYYQRYLAVRGKLCTGTSRMFTTSLWSQILFGDVVGTRIWRCSFQW